MELITPAKTGMAVDASQNGEDININPEIVSMNETKTILSLYYRVGCHLCTQMAAALYALQDELNYQVELIDIDLDAALQQRYNVDIPVVVYRDEVICYHFFDEISLRQAIASE